MLLCGFTNAVHEIRQVRVETACDMSLSLAKRGVFQGINSLCKPATGTSQKQAGNNTTKLIAFQP